jgi:thiol-disulfide isomerase/thioredoxin
MKARHLKLTASLLAIAASTSLALADKTLKVGDPAPKLQTGKWIQGEPVKEFENGKAYVVEFWATWCGPCREAIPHLNETYKKYKDKGLFVIGQNCAERKEGLTEPFVQKMGDKMTYRVALDDNGKMLKTWMEAAGQNGIPCSFLVDTKGSIAWIGSPFNLKEKTIEEVLAGKYDIKKAAEAAAKEEKATADMRKVSDLLRKGDYPAAYEVAAKISEDNKDQPMVQNQLAWQIATDKSIKDRNLELAETIAERGVKASKSQDPAILDTLARVKFMRGQKDDAIALQEKALKLASAEEKAQYRKVLEGYKNGELAKVEEN